MAGPYTSETSQLASIICNQISFVFTRTTSSAMDTMVREISKVATQNGKVFVYGVGREGLMLKALSMRLYHLGLSSHCVSDMTTPPIESSDLLIVSAGPGSFPTVDAICGVARSNCASVLLITSRPDPGTTVRFATAVAFLSAQTMADDEPGYDDGDQTRSTPLLPMGSLYEAAMFVLFEMVVYKLSLVLDQSPQDMRARHTNLE